jgi:hypothetical protein
MGTGHLGSPDDGLTVELARPDENPEPETGTETTRIIGKKQES